VCVCVCVQSFNSSLYLNPRQPNMARNTPFPLPSRRLVSSTSHDAFPLQVLLVCVARVCLDHLKQKEQCVHVTV